MLRIHQQRAAALSCKYPQHTLAPFEIEQLRKGVQWFRSEYGQGRDCIIAHVSPAQYLFYTRHLERILKYHNLPVTKIKYIKCIICIEFPN